MLLLPAFFSHGFLDSVLIRLFLIPYVELMKNSGYVVVCVLEFAISTTVRYGEMRTSAIACVYRCDQGLCI